MKRAFSLIELVFAIVIIGISVSVLPRIIVQSQRSNEFSVKQELIYHAKSMMGRVMQVAWDSGHLMIDCRNSSTCDETNSTQVNERSMSVPIYNISLPGGNSNERIGIVSLATIPNAADNLTLFSKGIFTPTNPNEFNRTSYGFVPNLNDIDDFNDRNFTIAPTVDSGDFITRVNVEVNVVYLDDTWAIGGHRTSTNITKELNTENNIIPTNIKKVTITARDQDSDYSVSLIGFFANIGEASFRTKQW